MSRRQLLNYFPGCGAIFIANKDTREECLRRKLFGLPRELEEFVLNVKRGMLLFLFDCTSKMLYGVFEASSDGGLNLVPAAFKSKFPAQVHIHVRWEFDPLPQKDFRDAIKDNYFTPYRFNLGLTDKQVDRLLNLFEKPKLNIQPSHMLVQSNQRHKNNVSSINENHPMCARKLKALQEVEDHNHNPGRNLPQTGNQQRQDVCSFTLTESLPKPKKLASLVGCDPKMMKRENEDDEENHKSSDLQVCGLYSENKKKCISVFQRLAGWPKVLEENRRPEPHKLLATPLYLEESGNGSENARDSLKRKIRSNVKTSAENYKRICSRGTKICDYGCQGEPKDSVNEKCELMDPVEILIAQYEDYLSRSRSEGEIQAVSVEEKVKLETCC